MASNRRKNIHIDGEYTYLVKLNPKLG